MSDVSVDITNLGGIESVETTLPVGITILSGQNASNRTSFLQSLAAALGADNSAATLKTDADEGSVRLEIADLVGTRTYERTNGTVVREGDPVSENDELVDTFVSIFSDNPARRAVRNGGADLHDILMRGVDTAEINATIHQLKHRRSAVTDKLDEIEAEKARLPSLEERRSELEEQLEAIEDEIVTVEAEIENHDTSNDDVEEAERHLEELERLRERLERTESEIDATKSTIEEAQTEQADIEANLEALDIPDADRATLEERRRELEDEIAAHKRAITDLNDIISNNRNLLDGENVLGAFDGEDDSATAALDPQSSTVQCWTCGTEVDRGTIERRVETLTDLRNEKNAELQALNEDLESVEASIESIESKRAKRDRLEADLESVTQTIQDERETLEDLEADAEDLQKEIRDVESRVENMEDHSDSPLADHYQRLSQLNHKRGQIESQFESITAELESVRSAVDRESDLRDERAAIQSELEEMRDHIDTVERDVVAQFNEQMDDLIDLLGYENISRVWIERIRADGDTAAFDLHVVRETDDGSVYEDTLDTLSESEREIIGIVVALSGYLVYDLSESVPVILFDSVEAIDATRLERLFDYVGDYASSIITALLPEEATAIDHPTVEAPFE